jgi:hypothetical protein
MIGPVAQAAGAIPSLDFAFLREWIPACLRRAQEELDGAALGRLVGRTLGRA